MDIGHGRIEQRHIALLPCEALSEDMRKEWDTIASIGQITRIRQHVRGGVVTKTETETNYVISSRKRPRPENILRNNRGHWAIEIMHRDKDVTLGEDRYTNRSDHAPANVFTLLSGALALLKRISKSPTKAIETVQDHRDKAITFLSKDINASFL